ncbi:GAF domain-containing protein [Roseateles sp. DAIF2]|uniref:GAF domain-containing protein n=1 Tax=Roseateles sp. DAIF2 TaxID=2714952 RepID=UPI0018A329D2|nr:GAF domain-containing protein [Roseateles sp. DAIF2]QPF73596.1 GAF domain-containing protein [Roseateles sp. DAIF2]
MPPSYDHAYLDATTLDVLISELLVATCDGCDPELGGRITELLSQLRRQLGMDLVFVSEFKDGQRVFRFVEGAEAAEALGIHAGGAAPLEQSYCQRVVQGRLPELVHDAETHRQSAGLPDTPFRVGAHLSTPVLLSDGRVYGTLCCFSTQPNPSLRAADLSRLKGCARLVARKVETSAARGATIPTGFRDTQVDWPALDP